MNLEFTIEEGAFREEVRCFLRDKLPKRLSDKVRLRHRLTKADMEEWHAILHARGWLGTHWPVEWGGPGWTTVQQSIFDIEAGLAYAPRILPFGLSMLAPVLIKFGSEDQKRHYLPRILDGTDWWCQGYSEPGAGSDLASLKTSAVRTSDHYVVNGQKTWTTLGQHADWIFCLVRTDPSVKKQAGISFLLIDLKTPGVEVRPITLLDGEQEVNEVFFTDVRVPIENRVGEENMGWTYAKYLLGYERTGIAGIGAAGAALDWLKEVSEREQKNGRPLTQDALFAARIARIEIELENLRTTNLRVLTRARGDAPPLADGAILKIRGTELRQQITALARRAVGPYAQPFVTDALEDGFCGEAVGPEYAAGLAADYFNARKLSIFGGSNEVQREIITKMTLEL